MRTTALTGVSILAAAVVAIACESTGGGRSGLESAARDSAGITIVDNQEPASETRLGWLIGEAPILSIGALEGNPAYELYQVRDAAKLPDGRIVVANAGSGELRVFDASGTHLASWGGRGEGPGEFGDFAAPWNVGPWPGDSIAASDLYARRVSVFDAHGAHGRTIVLGDPYYRLFGVMPDGKMCLGTIPAFEAGTMGTGMVRREVEYAIASPDGSLHVALGTYPASEWYIFAEGGGMAVYPQPFRHSAIAQVWGDLIVIGSNDLYEIRAFTADGALTRIVRREHDVRSPTRAESDAHLDELYEDRTEQQRARARAELEDMPLLETFPAFGRVLTDSRGHLWVEDYQLPGASPPPWTVFDPEGRVLGLMELPPDLSVREIGEDYILGSVSDDFGIERVQLWPLDRSGF
ncbi:hypothetical protein [Candidatus Palauibacter sp.]|uniref:hypothetical protein n=1 Tax=Candidatus Palauibacter sp. TaxID=3101350 RepID=UPI003AF2098E